MVTQPSRHDTERADRIARSPGRLPRAINQVLTVRVRRDARTALDAVRQMRIPTGSRAASETLYGRIESERKENEMRSKRDILSPSLHRSSG